MNQVNDYYRSFSEPFGTYKDPNVWQSLVGVLKVTYQTLIVCIYRLTYGLFSVDDMYHNNHNIYNTVEYVIVCCNEL